MILLGQIFDQSFSWYINSMHQACSAPMPPAGRISVRVHYKRGIIEQIEQIVLTNLFLGSTSSAFSGTDGTQMWYCAFRVSLLSLSELHPLLSRIFLDASHGVAEFQDKQIGLLLDPARVLHCFKPVLQESNQKKVLSSRVPYTIDEIGIFMCIN